MTFPLEIVSLDGQKFAGEAERLSLRTMTGELAIMAKHTNYITGVGMGMARVILPDGTTRKAACIGGMLTMIDNKCRLIPMTFEWSDEIDVVRAQKSKALAEERLAAPDITPRKKEKAEARLLRAMIRLQTAEEDS